MANHIQSNVTLENVEALPLTELAERLVYDDAALNAVCEKMIDAAQRILNRNLQEDDAWPQAERDLTPEQRLQIWQEAIASIS